jgi:hypothetical protein
MSLWDAAEEETIPLFPKYRIKDFIRFWFHADGMDREDYVVVISETFSYVLFKFRRRIDAIRFKLEASNGSQ